ncbi:MAG: hypothetical protein ILO36_01345 [Abditibacteriota bacterium]|nr:hypothetical protein [Abditibacteriota bacterium]
MKCTCGKEFVEGQAFCTNCKRTVNKPGYGILGDETNALYSLKELDNLKNNGLLKTDDRLIKFPQGEQIIAGAVLDFSKKSIPETFEGSPQTERNSKNADSPGQPGMRIAALVFLILCPFIAIILSAIGFDKASKEDNKSDKQMFMAILIISIILFIVEVCLVLFSADYI